MAEWLTHIFIAYAVFTTLSWSVSWVTERWVAVGMIGSILPDLDRLTLILGSDIITYLVGIDFTWGGIHTVIGIVLFSAIGALLFEERIIQYRAFVSLLTGAISHLFVDLPQRYADGRMTLDTYMSPIPAPRPPTPGWYVTPDRWVVVVAFVVALLAFVTDWYRK